MGGYCSPYQYRYAWKYETGDEVLEDILFKNIDILEHDEDDRDYQGLSLIHIYPCESAGIGNKRKDNR